MRDQEAFCFLCNGLHSPERDSWSGLEARCILCIFCLCLMGVGGGMNLFFEQCVWLNVKLKNWERQEYFWVALISRLTSQPDTRLQNCN